ncbi:hypothetical protein ACFL23_04405 [Patescibacteria group bacterium]
MGLSREQLKIPSALDGRVFLWLEPDLIVKQQNNKLLRDILGTL